MAVIGNVIQLNQDNLIGELGKDLEYILSLPGQAFTNYKAGGKVVLSADKDYKAPGEMTVEVTINPEVIVVQSVDGAVAQFSQLDIPGVGYFSRLKKALVLSPQVFKTHDDIAHIASIAFRYRNISFKVDNVILANYNITYLNTPLVFPPKPVDMTKFNEEIDKIFGSKRSSIILKEIK